MIVYCVLAEMKLRRNFFLGQAIQEQIQNPALRRGEPAHIEIELLDSAGAAGRFFF
jgi:hypothetical protein